MNLDAKLWKIFSEYIRKRDSDDNGYIICISCGRWVKWKESDAGHFISRRFECTKYDEKNVNAQCVKCNRFENGNQYEQSLRIDKKWGEGTSKDLSDKSKMTCKKDRYTYEYLINEYKQKIKEIER